MGVHSRDEKLLMYFFQDNLPDPAVVWYTNLEASRIRSWKDLITAFSRQYQYNTDMAPDRTQLQNMCKKEHESIKEYAQRWRDLAAQVVPPMMEREMITMIVDTLPVFYYEKLVGYMPSSFTDLIFTPAPTIRGWEQLRQGRRKAAPTLSPPHLLSLSLNRPHTAPTSMPSITQALRPTPKTLLPWHPAN